MPSGVNRYTITHSITLALWLWIFAVVTDSHVNNTVLSDTTIYTYLIIAIGWSAISFPLVFHQAPIVKPTKTASTGLSFVQASSIGFIALCTAVAYVWTFTVSSSLNVLNTIVLFLFTYIVLYLVITDNETL